MQKVASIFAAVVMAATISPVQAKDDRPQPPSFEQLDSNGDGQLSKGEVKGHLLQDFDKFDNDRSGTLTKSEIPEPPKSRR